MKTEKYTLINTKDKKYIHKRCLTSGFGILNIKNPTTKDKLDIKTWKNKVYAQHYLKAYILYPLEYAKKYRKTHQRTHKVFYGKNEERIEPNCNEEWAKKIEKWEKWFKKTHKFKVIKIK